MTATATRRRAHTASLTGARMLGGALRSAPGVVGASLVCAGLALAWVPLGLVAAGVFLLALDRRIP